MIGSLTRTQYATKIAISPWSEPRTIILMVSRESKQSRLSVASRLDVSLAFSTLTRRRTYRNLSLPPMSPSTGDSSTARPFVASIPSLRQHSWFIQMTTLERTNLVASDGLTRFSRVTCSFSWLRRPTSMASLTARTP